MCFWFIFYNDLLLVEEREGKNYTIPCGEHPPVPLENPLTVSAAGHTVYIAGVANAGVWKTGSYILVGLRAALETLDAPLSQMAGKAFQLVFWEGHSHFCPACGTETKSPSLPVMRFCPACRYELYPVISTAILALVRKGDEILLVRARNFRRTFHSLVAGFLETGETLEECVAREVKEETTLDVRNITYFGNQSWPFPSGLMVGFTADYAGGEIRLQDEELTAGAFYTRGNLPELPRKWSLARRMIDWWLMNPSSAG